MLSLKDVADYVATLGVVNADHIWIGKLQDKVEKSIGVYPMRGSGSPHAPVGGTDHDTKKISILVHWNKNVVDAEETAFTLFNALLSSKDVTINEKRIMFNQLLVPEPVSVGTDDNGIYEYVIETEIYYEK